MKDPLPEDAACDEMQSPIPEPEPWVKEGLRALRDREPSEDSKRATLARLGIAPTPALENSTASVPSTAAMQPAPTPRVAVPRAESHRALLRWLLWGFALGALLLLAQRYLMH
jgi:hypothetical protein